MAGGCLEAGALGRGQLQRAGYLLGGEPEWPGETAFQVLDAADAQAGALSERFLRQAGCQTIVPEHGGEGVTAAGCQIVSSRLVTAVLMPRARA
jgi:hypothetical protein